MNKIFSFFCTLVLSAVSVFGQIDKEVRYVSIADVEKDKRQDYVALISFVTNSISKERTIVKAVDCGDGTVKVFTDDLKLTKIWDECLGKEKLSVDKFVYKVFSPSIYPKLISINNLNELKKSVGFKNGSFEVSVVRSGLIVKTNIVFTRYPVVNGYLWSYGLSDGQVYNFTSTVSDQTIYVASARNGLRIYLPVDDKGNYCQLDEKVFAENNIIDLVCRNGVIFDVEPNKNDEKSYDASLSILKLDRKKLSTLLENSYRHRGK